ncbi:hypothetical protein [Herbiconiux sp. VKM Ac-2851]|uniref:hypothetical protein n=1 Tax=Herbiconiux sp. VKM Ac-2851 TaxID=2739025 RepID=UPI0015674B5C|nr:hypothetical protein [Herbiconiux sp. VKM Ac-2851]NQX36049.1 hypothetical protein [Herbiconiux sp. VKM Ac-2851]
MAPRRWIAVLLAVICGLVSLLFVAAAVVADQWWVTTMAVVFGVGAVVFARHAESFGRVRRRRR